MSKVLAISFLAMISFEAVGAITCKKCKTVGVDNRCTETEDSCDAHFWRFCYTRMYKRGGKIKRVDRGCTFLCHSIKRAKKNYEEKMLCCVADFCNDHNFWTND